MSVRMGLDVESLISSLIGLRKECGQRRADDDIMKAVKSHR